MEPDESFSVLSNASIASDNGQKTKKRRLHGACDACRKKKVKCDSAKMPDNICTNCQLLNIECTHDTPRQPKKSETQAIYIQTLENKVAKMLQLLHDAYPDQDIDHLVETASNPTSENSTPDPPSFPTSSLRQTDPGLRYPPLQSTSNERISAPPVETVEDPSELEDLEHIALTKQLTDLSLDSVEDRFFGVSSGFMFVKHVSAVKSDATGNPIKLGGSNNFKRPIFWNVRPWEIAFATTEEPRYIYPEEDLLQALVFIYFDKFNPLYPLLHQPTFMRKLSRNEHHKDSSFGMTVLLVCACASRYSNDPRVMMPGDISGLSSGWRFFCQVPLYRNKLIQKSGLYDLQYYALAMVYLHSTSVPNTGWNILGLAMRHAIEKGIHRRKPSAHKPTAEEELSKRAFWCLIMVDRFMSSFLGRPSVINDEDFDLDYPIECDDEYWETEDPNQAFKQPPGKPSTITAFVQMIKLCEILAFTLRTMYSTKKSKVLSGLIGNEWESRIVAQLNASMNNWKDSLPYFLHWNPDGQNQIFFQQSSYLYATYYYIQILIHRPFLTKKSVLSFPALAACTNAARAAADKLEVTATRGLRITTPNLIMAIVSAGLVTLLNIWGNQKSGLVTDPKRDMEVLQKCLHVLSECERRSPMAARLHDLLDELAAVNQYQHTSKKRQREQTESMHAQLTTAPFDNSFLGHPSTMTHDPMVIPSGPQMPPLNTVSNMPVNEWENLTDLFLIQMGYMRPNMGSDNSHGIHESSTGYPPSDNSVVLPTMGGMPTDFSLVQLNNTNFALDSSPNSNNDETLALWFDIPATFHSIDQWDAYIANVGTF